ncbi:unnamed protein product [Caenorhabditis sp. 36 PRJEB53466]|nr:unnamed protein product [Caenorhabditis sp. 36 PRJEB53466]
MLRRLFFASLLLFLCSAAPADQEITTLPNLTEPLRSKHYAGYLPISDLKQLFYWYVESEESPATAPTILWLNGGPGCASMEGLFIEMGPFRVRNDGEEVNRNPWTWNRIANIIYLDAPAGVGYSYYNTTKPAFTDDEVAQDNFDALKLWFENAIHGQPDCASHSDHFPYLNAPEVRKALRIPDYVQKYEMCSMAVAELYTSQYADMKQFFGHVIKAKKRVAMFNGDADSICNYVENSQFIYKTLNRSLTAKMTYWNDANQLPMAVGQVTEYDGITLISIKGGGHFPAATEQKPKESFQMFQNYVRNQNYSTPVTFDRQWNATGATSSSTSAPTTTSDATTTTEAPTTTSFVATTKYAKILVEKNPETAENRERIRSIIAEAFANRIPRVQGRQGTGSRKLVAATANHGPKNNRTTRFEVLNRDIHNYTFESDIMLNEKQARQLAKSIENGNYRSKRQAIVEATNFWNVSVPIYYQFDSTLSATNIANVRKAIQYWNDNSCLSFSENSNGLNRLFLTSAGGCWSYVGRQNDAPYQLVSVGPGCDTLGTATHELMHAIGFWHQQSRADRDDFVYIDFGNIMPSQAYNFQKMPVDTAQLLGIPYDYGSVMQYYPYAFAVDSTKYTILAKDSPYQNSLGQREAPAFGDVIGVNKLYNCTALCATQMTCSNSGFTDSRNCSQCKCPHYFTGPTCDDLPKGTAVNCNGDVLQATSSWSTFNATAGDPNSYTATTDTSTNCFWHIKAPSGQKLEFKLTTAPLSAICMQECPWQSVELNLGKFDLYGIITCCNTLLNQVFTSEADTIAMRGIVRYNQLKFSVQYRAIPTNSSGNSTSTQ